MNPENVDSIDLLISRIVDRADRDGDWDAFDQLQRTGTPVRAALLEALRADAGVRSMVEVAVAAAGRVEVDAGRRGWRLRQRAAAGWLLAALLAGAWFVDARSRTSTSNDVPAAKADLLDSRELSRTVLQARPIDGSDRFEVLSVRRVLERRVVDRLYELAEDEHGRPVATTMQTAALAVPRSY